MISSSRICAQRRGAAAGHSGMSADRLFPLLDSERDSMKLFEFASFLGRGAVPAVVTDITRMERFAARSTQQARWRCAQDHSW